MGTMEEEDVGKFLSSHPNFLKDWILNHADQKVLEDLSQVIQVKAFRDSLSSLFCKLKNAETSKFKEKPYSLSLKQIFDPLK